MRSDIPQAIIDALAEDATSAVQIRLSGGRSLLMSWTRAADCAPAWADAAGAQAAPLAQDFCIVEGIGYTALVYDGELWVCNQFSEPMQVTVGGITLEADSYSRPAISQGRNANELRVYYCTGTAIQFADLDRALVDAGTGECVLEGDYHLFAHRAALHSVSLDELVALWIDDGGVRATLIDLAADTESSWWGRFMFHGTALYEADSGQAAWLNYSAVVEYDGKIFAYLSAPTGELMGVCYRRGNWAWSDSFTAVPNDMSRFLAGKAVVIEDAIHLAGMFYRYDPEGTFTAGAFYTLLLASTDGRTFALDRSTAVTGGLDSDTESMALRFMVGYSAAPDSRYGGANLAPLLVFSDANRWFAQEPHFGIDGVVDGYDFQDCIMGQVTWGQAFDLTVPFKTNEDADQIEVGDAADVYFGVRVPDGPLMEYLAARCLVMDVREATSGASRSLTVSLVSFSDGKLLEMAHPMMLRKLGKEFLHDTLSGLDNFDLASEDGFVLFPLALDFWGQGEVEAETHNAMESWEFVTRELDEELDIIELPEIEELPFEIHVYGWSRSGQPSADSNGQPLGDDPSIAGAPNDEIYVNLYVEREGEISEVVVPIKTPASGYVNHFPQTWKATEAGDYPIVFSASTGLEVGDRIKKVGMVFANTRTPNTAETVFLPERCEFPTVMTKVRSFRDAWAAIQPVEVDKIIVIVTETGVFYTEEADVEAPTWQAFNTGLDDAADLDSVVYDPLRGYYYAAGPSGLWRAESLGGTWELVWAAATATPKLIDTGWTLRSRLASEANGSGYWGVYCASDGAIFCHGGETPGSGAFVALFRSLDGLETIEPTTRLIADGSGGSHTDVEAVHNIIKLPSGRVVFGFTCGYGTGSDTNYDYSDDNGGSLSGEAHDDRSLVGAYSKPTNFTNNGNKLVMFFGQDEDLVVAQDGYPRTKYANALPHPTPSLSGRMLQLVTYSRRGGRLAAILNNDGFYVNDVDLTDPDEWTLMETLDNPRCVAASRVANSAWWVGDAGGEVLYSDDDGATWSDKSGDLGTMGALKTFVRITSGPATDEDDAEDGQALQRVGIPVVEFATRPFYALGCQVSLKAALEGENAYAGVLCLASDGINYVVARASVDAVELVRVRGGAERELASAVNTFPSPMGWIMLRYQDGLFQVYVKSSREKVWSEVLEYEWAELDGALLADSQASHVGFYALQDTPYAKLCGLDLAATDGAGILPLAHKIDDFPASGEIRVDDCIYSYDSIGAAPAIVGGPYQGRNVSGPYAYSNDGEAYSGNAAEFQRFEWLDNAAHSEDFLGDYLATDTAIHSEIGLVDFQPYITTDDVQVTLRDRGRFFCGLNSDVIGMRVRVWLTDVLLGLQRVAGEETSHGCGTVAYVISEASVRIYEFAAITDGRHLTDREALDWIAKFSRATARFPGDITAASQSLATPWEAR